MKSKNKYIIIQIKILDSKLLDCCIRELVLFHMTVLLKSIDLSIVLLKGGAVCYKC